MAVNLQPIRFTIDLQNVVRATTQLVAATRQKENARKEAAFAKAIAEGMSYADQLAFRQKQLEAEQKSPFADPDYLVDLETSIGTAKKQVRFEKIRNAYTASLNDYISGKGSLDTYASVLEQSMQNESDPQMVEKLQSMLSEVVQKRATIELNAVKNRVTVAEKDGSIELIDQSYAEVQAKRANAAINGDDDEVAMWDDTLLGLKQSKSKIQIETAVNEFTFRENKGNPKADEKLTYFDQAFDSADKSTPITYDGVQYESAAAFWDNMRASYIKNSYFADKSAELDAETERVADLSPNGVIPVGRVKAVADAYDALKNRPGFENYLEQIDQAKVSKTSEAINNIYNTQLDAMEARIGNLADPLGADYEAYKNEYAQTERLALALEGQHGVSLTRLPFENERTVAENVLNAPVNSSFTEKNQAEIKRAQDVYGKADTLAGTGKYTGQTAEQIREAAHNYANDIRSGKVNLDALPDVAVEPPVTAPKAPALATPTTPKAATPSAIPESTFSKPRTAPIATTKTPIAAKPVIATAPAAKTSTVKTWVAGDIDPTTKRAITQNVADRYNIDKYNPM